MPSHLSQKEKTFNDIVKCNDRLIRKVCYMYADDIDHFRDLYQETLITLWQGLDKFKGRSKISTWIYRATINTCISSLRRTARHREGRRTLDAIIDIPSDDTQTTANLRRMYDMIASLRDMDKSIILMWLDELSYDEIAAITGLTRNNVASRLRRIKLQLIKDSDG